MTAKIVGCIELRLSSSPSPRPILRCFDNPGKREILSVFYELDCHPHPTPRPFHFLRFEGYRHPVNGFAPSLSGMAHLPNRFPSNNKQDLRLKEAEKLVGVTVSRNDPRCFDFDGNYAPYSRKLVSSLIPEIRFIRSFVTLSWTPFTTICNWFLA